MVDFEVVLSRGYIEVWIRTTIGTMGTKPNLRMHEIQSPFAGPGTDRKTH